MKLILLKDVNDLGHIGQEVEVKDGYARNYLIPQELAAVKSDPRAREVLIKAKEEAIKAEREQQEFRDMAKKINNQIYIIKAKIGTTNKLFGAITSSDAVKAINNKDIKIIAKQVEMEPIKTLGEHQVLIKFAKDITAMVKLKVEAIKK
ncbi:MAG: 50S ribosomal protein L9 [Patescibacteria group bacterium]|nr:50S ribosomal protein L9 [Patescibacteria group bacterium]